MVSAQPTLSAIITSFVAHAFVLMIIGLTVHFTPITFSVEMHKIDNCAYLYHMPAVNIASIKDKTPIKKAKLNKLPKQHVKPATREQSSAAGAVSQETVSHDTRADEWLAYLHAAIQAKQHYPESALQMEREGRVRLAFLLYQDGTIANLKIVQTSGTDSLDKAALQAVQDAIPFAAAKKWLTAPQTYQVDIVFALTG